MVEDDFVSVVSDMRLADGRFFPIPVYLDVFERDLPEFQLGSCVDLMYHDEKVGELYVESIFSWNKLRAAQQVFGVDSRKHPGVVRMLDGGDWLIGGLFD